MWLLSIIAIIFSIATATTAVTERSTSTVTSQVPPGGAAAKRAVTSPETALVSLLGLSSADRTDVFDVVSQRIFKALTADRKTASNAPSGSHSLPTRRITVLPKTAQAPFLKEPPIFTEEQRRHAEVQLERIAEARRQYRVPTDPTAHPEKVVPGPQTTAANQLAPTGSISVFRDTVLTDVMTNDQVSDRSAEPSVGTNDWQTFYTGNWFAALSNDYGETFSYINPFTLFPAVNGGFCCDQVVYYEPTRDITVWYLQYVADATGNTGRLAVANGHTDLSNNLWTYYDFTPQALGYPAGAWFDYPDISVSNNFLYWTTNVLQSGNNDLSVVFHFDLDELDAGGGVTALTFAADTRTLRPTHGATTMMYFGTHEDTNTLRIYTWPEADGGPWSTTTDVDAWFNATSTAPSPDGTDWVAFDAHWITGAWVADGVLGFMWDSSQGGDFPWPNVRYARFRPVPFDFDLVDQGQIWNSDYAWAYPSVHPNDRGDIAGTIAKGGGGTDIPYPRLSAWIADAFNDDTIQPLENVTIANSDIGPGVNRWGDYFTARRHVPYGNTWVGTGFVDRSSEPGSNSQPHFLHFGRGLDEPPANYDDLVFVDKANTSGDEDGTHAHPYNTFAEGYAEAQNGDAVIVSAGSYPETGTFSKNIGVFSLDGTAIIGQ